MATEVCTGACCVRPIQKVRISVEVILEGCDGKDRINLAVSRLSTTDDLSVKSQRRLAEEIGRIMSVKPYHDV